MPEEDSITGEFSGAFTVESPEIKNSEIKMIEGRDGRLSFIVDNEVENPNVVDAEVESIAYRIYSDSEVVKTGSVDVSSSIRPGEERFVAVELGVAMDKLVSPSKSFEESTEEMKIQGVIRFSSAGEIFDKYFENRFSAS